MDLLIVTAGTSSSAKIKKYVKRGTEVEVDLIIHILTIGNISRYRLVINWVYINYQVVMVTL